MQGSPSTGTRRLASETVKQSSAAKLAASSPATERTRIKVVLNIGCVELELLRTLKEIRSIDPLARFQVLAEICVLLRNGVCPCPLWCFRGARTEAGQLTVFLRRRAQKLCGSKRGICIHKPEFWLWHQGTAYCSPIMLWVRFIVSGSWTCDACTCRCLTCRQATTAPLQVTCTWRCPCRTCRAWMCAPLSPQSMLWSSPPVQQVCSRPAKHCNGLRSQASCLMRFLR